ncbi:MAG: hypothetical protein ACFFDK_05955 [Promethearchaeota archaeon]
MKYALMFNVLKDGEIEPIKWNREVFLPDRSIIILEELTPAVWLWHGDKRSLVDRRIASRQAENLKGYGYKARDTIIGSRTRIIKEIDQKKVGKDAETDAINQEFQEILHKEFNLIDDIIVDLQMDEDEVGELKLAPTAVPETISEQASKVTAEFKAEKVSQKTQKPKAESVISDTTPEPEIKPSPAKTKQVSKPTRPIKKPEFLFEEQVKEVGSNTNEIIKNILKRIEKMEIKLDTLLQEFKEFKASFQK